MYLSGQLSEFVEKSKLEINRAKKRKRNFAIAAVILLLVVFSGFTIWAMRERGKAKEQAIVADKQKNEAIEANKKAIDANKEATKERDNAELAKQQAIEEKAKAEKSATLALEMKNKANNAKNIAVKELYDQMSMSLSTELPGMNVVYIGIENPLKLSASGIRDENFLISAEGGSVKYSDGLYYVMPNQVGIMKIYIRGKTNKGDVIDLGVREFRVKRVPDPVPAVGGKSGGIIRKSDLLKYAEVEALMPNFAFDLNFYISEFSISAMIDGYANESITKGSKFSDNQIKIIKIANEIYIENVKVTGPDGTEKEIGSIKFTFMNELNPNKSFEENLDSLGKNNLWDEYYYWIQNTDNITDEELIIYYSKLINPGSISVEGKEILTSNCVSKAYYLLFENSPDKSIKFSLLAEKADPENKILYTNLALAYLLNNDWASAEKIYIKYKEESFGEDPNHMTPFRDAFLEDLKALEEAGITHPDFAKVRKLLNDTAKQ
jgi:hypothetical protein